MSTLELLPTGPVHDIRARREIHITQPSSHGHMAVRKCLEDQCAVFLRRLPAGSRIPLPNTSGRLPGCLDLGVMGGGAGGGLAGGLTLLARRRQLQPQIAPQVLRCPCLTIGIKNLSLKALQRCGMLRIMWQDRRKRCSCTRCIGTSRRCSRASSSLYG